MKLAQGLGLYFSFLRLSAESKEDLKESSSPRAQLPLGNCHRRPPSLFSGSTVPIPDLCMALENSSCVSYKKSTPAL